MTILKGFVGNTNLLEIIGLQNDITMVFINNATVTVTVQDSSGADVAGMTWPATMNYVAASDGDYRVALKDDLVLIHKDLYHALIRADGGLDLIASWRFPFKPTWRVK